MLFASNEDDPEREFREIELFSAHRVAGLIVAPTSHGPDYPARLTTTIRTPAVLVDRVIPDSRFDAVLDDNHLGAQLVTRHLLTLGHRDIAFLVGRPGISPSDERFEGFCQTMAAAGVAVREDLVQRSCYKFDHAFTAVQQLMNMAAPPTAIACINIAQLLGTMAGLKNIGLSVPKDVSVISFDGFHPAEGWTPSITSLHQDIATISARASERLMVRIAGDAGAPETIRIPPRLHIRESCRAI
jgi:LacI family transcriptional regulator